MSAVLNGLRFSENIAALRKSKKITQEELAEFMGVTKASVSKWETGATMPDIGLLPLLASFFDITVDALIGYEPQLGREQIQAFYQKYAEAFAKRPFMEVMEEIRRLVHKYYACYPFLQQVVVLWSNHLQMAGDEQAIKAAASEINDLCEHILQNCKNMTIYNNVTELKALNNLQTGRAEEVIEAMEDRLDINRAGSGVSLLTLAYMNTGNIQMAKKSAQIGTFRGMGETLNSGIQMLSMEQDAERIEEILKRMDALCESFQLKRLNPNSETVYQYQAAVSYCKRLAALLAAEGNCTDTQSSGDEAPEQDVKFDQDKVQQQDEKPGQDEALGLEKRVFERLDRYAEAAKQLLDDGIAIHSDLFFDQLDSWFSSLELGSVSVRNLQLVRESVLEGFANPLFAVLRDQERLQHYIKIFEEHK